MTALCVAFWATFLLVLVDHVSKQCLLYAVGCATQTISVPWHNLKKLPDVAAASLGQQENPINKKHGECTVSVALSYDRNCSWP
jgi:hypothetical protein